MTAKAALQRTAEVLAGPWHRLDDAAEQAIARHLRAEDRDDARAARLLLQSLLAEHTGSTRRVVQVCNVCGGNHGRPTLPDLPALGVSMAHSRGWVAAAIGEGDCGVDVEEVPRLRPVASALTSAEAAWLERQDDTRIGFARLWVRKEAIIKAGRASLDEVSGLDVLVGDEPATTVGGLQIDELLGPGLDGRLLAVAAIATTRA